MTVEEVQKECSTMTVDELEAVEAGQRRLAERREELGICSKSARANLTKVREELARRLAEKVG